MQGKQTVFGRSNHKYASVVLFTEADGGGAGADPEGVVGGGHTHWWGGGAQ